MELVIWTYHCKDNSSQSKFYILFSEVTALRAKVHEMREMSLTQEGDITDRVRKQYEDVVHSLFDSTAKLKLRLDEFRLVWVDLIHFVVIG
jgi:hypothetical protein